ncbi:MAG: hypothetical protein JWO94_242 [Verrucomicrobiaceae bacterium]|nr:hypothetical protein [Verrucomicrobiaceae bacterium]
MKHGRAIWFLALLFWAGAAMKTSAQVVTPDGTPPASRLEQLETTYNELLKGTHEPLLKNYLATLQAMQGKALTAADTAALKAETARVQDIIAGKSIVEFEVPKSEVSPAAKVVRKSGIVFTLDPVEAFPLPANASNPDAVVPLGTAAWKLSSLPPGTYDVVAHYACPAPPPAAKLHVSFAGQEADRELKAAQTTTDAKTFRVMRLCQFTLKQEASLQTLVITASPSGEPWLTLKQVLVVKAKSE